MRRIITILILITIPFSGFAKEYLNAAIKIDLEKELIIGLMEIEGEEKVFSFSLSDADFNDGHTIVIYKNWLPEIPEGYGLRMHIFRPEGYMLVTESNRSKETYTGVRYEYDNPEHGVVLALSDRWVQETKEYKGVDISTFFTLKNRKFSLSYFDRVKQLLDIYTEKLGPYPYSSFNVVDVPYPAGHALKSMTLISTNIIGMPFLTEVSLGHELVHQWFGVGVDVDIDGGNWAEALTTYYADRLYADMKGEGAEYRKNTLASYMAHARQKEEGTCLLDFKYNKNKTAQAVGYGKGLMVFTMLESILGVDDFDKSIRIFTERFLHKKADWQDIITIMQDVSGLDIDGFLDGWLAETALVDFSVSGARINGEADGYSVSFEISNKYEWLEYPLEVAVKTDSGEVNDYLYIDKKKETFTIKTKTKPLEIIFDPEYKVPRLLSDSEMTPVLHHLFSKYPKAVFVKPSEQDKYEAFIGTLSDAEVVSDEANPYKYSDRILIFLGSSNKAYQKVYREEVPAFDGEFMVKSVKHPMGNDRMSYIVISKDAETTSANARRISHYGKYSSLKLTDGHRYEKQIDESDEGFKIDMNSDKQGVAVSKPLSISDIVHDNSDIKLWLIGEKHDEYAHHENQYELIKTLQENGHDVAVGLEMMQRPFQKYLDAYIAGEIDEAHMLAETEYFDRWRFDFRLYKRIFDYAKANSIPLVALNLEKELTKKVSRAGVESLSDDDLAKLPADIEYTQGDYKERLVKIFGMHPTRNNFDNFYEAQLLWDETMAESAYNYMTKNPEKTLVIIAGNGHMEYGYGIADRVKRRSGDDYTLIVQDMEYAEGVADYILYPEKMDFAQSPKIGVMVDETDDGLLVKGVLDDTVASKAGVIKGDYITELNGVEIFGLSDIKIALTYAEKGESYEMKVERDGETVSLTATF
ncbi:MAG: hypothetical protein C0602_12695 [Denitrovibrio sp.]|nr:MAG: hypothetical protein C0602_12695 [Denitrovibrio sp.]